MLPDLALDRVDPLRSPARQDDGSLIDILVVYSQDALIGAGSVDAINADIDSAITTTNRAFENSKVQTRLRLVHSAAIDYWDSGKLRTDIDNIRLRNSEVASLRDIYAADLVALIVNKADDAVGMAYTPGMLSVTVRSQLPWSTFAHEIGHNLGGQHDWYMTRSGGKFAYSKGHVDIQRAFFTVMAYSSHCVAADPYYGCSQVLHFSSPHVFAEGGPTGVAEGTNRSCREENVNNPPCDADNARTFTHMARITANYRASKALDLSFPPRNETYEFRQTLETTYRDTLARQPTQTYVDLEGSVVWMQEYLRYRLNACDHATATENVLQQIHYPSRPHEPVCRNVVLFPGQELFPPRDEPLAFLQRLQYAYQARLHRNPVPTYVDEEGVAVWIQEYLRHRVYGRSHGQALERTLRSIRNVTTDNPNTGGGSGNDAIDLSSVTWLHDNVSGWAQTSTITSASISGSDICIRHTKAGAWPSVTVSGTPLEGNPWVFANIGGKWYAGTYGSLRPGQVCKGITAGNIGPSIKQSPMTSWRPRSGEKVGFMVSTPARFGPHGSRQERSNVVMVTWP